MTHSEFDHAPDPALGAALREVLDVSDDPAFVHRVTARLGTSDTWWQVLGTWARPGMVAALLLVAAGGFLFGRAFVPVAASGVLDVPTLAVEVSSLFGEDRAPTLDQVLAEGLQTPIEGPRR
jgi:hypothetical protein